MRQRPIAVHNPQKRDDMIDERIVKFFKKHHVLTLATVSDTGAPYCSNAFYAYDSERNVFAFAADDTTRHAAEMTADPRVAASIVLETRIVGKVQGAQICGTAADGNEDDKRVYLRRFPYAATMPNLKVRRLTPHYIKLTDNTLGFGKKLIWTKG